MKQVIVVLLGAGILYLALTGKALPLLRGAVGKK